MELASISTALRRSMPTVAKYFSMNPTHADLVLTLCSAYILCSCTSSVGSGIVWVSIRLKEYTPKHGERPQFSDFPRDSLQAMSAFGEWLTGAEVLQSVFIQNLKKMVSLVLSAPKGEVGSKSR